MYQYGALLGLFLGVAADIYKRLDDVVEGVHIIVIEKQTASAVFQGVDLFFRFRAYVGLLFHFL